MSFDFVKVCGIRFSIWESFIGFYFWCYPISTILACLFTFGVRISRKKLCWKGSMAAIMASRVSYLVLYYCIESEFEQIITKRRWSIKDNTTNCTVSFIDLYLVFPTNFRIVLLPHTNNVILLEPYCVVLSQNLGNLCTHQKISTNKKILAVPEIPMLQFSLIPIDAHIYRFTTP